MGNGEMIGLTTWEPFLQVTEQISMVQEGLGTGGLGPKLGRRGLMFLGL